MLLLCFTLCKCIFFYRDCTLHEALAVLEENEDLEPRMLYIEPPDPAVRSDEDSADEDEGGFINNLSGRQLNARCEVVLASSSEKPRQTRSTSRRNLQSASDILEAGPSSTLSRGSSKPSRGSRVRSRGSRGFRTPSRGSRSLPRGSHSSRKRSASRRGGHRLESNVGQDDDSSNDSDESDEVEPPPKKSKNTSRTWIDDDLLRQPPIYPEGNFSAFRGKSAVDMLDYFLGESVVNLLVDQSQKYAAFLNCQDPKISHKEMRVFIAILILSGYNTVPSKRHYWDQGEDMRNHMVHNCMRRDRFMTIMRFLHCADNNEMVSTDKMWKLRPLINIIKKKFLENYVPSATLNYDESMIEYFGKHGCKQFIRGKPIRFGFKNWCLNTPWGYLVDFEIYQGKSIQDNPEYDKMFGKAASPLVKMIDNLPEHVKLLPTSFYFDNLFTGFQLLTHLKSRGYEGTGTVRENRLPNDIPLTNKKAMIKAQRGTYVHSKSNEEDIIVVRWKDNSVVTAMSTLHGVEPLSNVTRYCAAEKKKIQVPRPAIFTEYNKHMGGTDLMDQNISTYRIGIRGKKWWWPIFTYLIDAAVCNAWVLSRQAGSTLTQLAFRREIVQTYLTQYRNVPRGAGRPAVSKSSKTGHRINDGIRYDGRNHLLVPSDSRRKCALESCKSQTRLQCVKCDVGLCASCNLEFHTLP